MPMRIPAKMRTSQRGSSFLEMVSWIPIHAPIPHWIISLIAEIRIVPRVVPRVVTHESVLSSREKATSTPRSVDAAFEFI